MARRFSWGSDARATWPRFRSVMVLELVVSVVVIGFASAHIVPFMFPVVAKAAMTEALGMASAGRPLIIEHFAITGRPLPTDVAPQSRLAEGPAEPEYEKHLSAARAFAAVAGAPDPKASSSHSRADGSATQLRFGVRDGSLVIIGRMSQLERPYRLTLMAAVRPGEEAAVARWVCGTASVPPGLALVGTRLEDDIPESLLPFDCRARRKP